MNKKWMPAICFFLGISAAAGADALKMTNRPVPKKRECFAEKLGMKFVRIPPGTFIMGSDKVVGTDFNPIKHKVTLTKSFSMQTTEVTQKQWQAVMGTTVRDQLTEGDLMSDEEHPNHPETRRRLDPSEVLYGEGDEHPIYYVSWNDAQAFIKKLNRLDPGHHYRLPTEAEWEYACRAGATGEAYGELDEIAWYNKQPGRYEEISHPVGQKRPNAWGLYDMLGNVSEWCEDWAGKYPSKLVLNPRGPSIGEDRVFRGGSFIGESRETNSSFREWGPPSERSLSTGFRLVRD